MARKAGTLAIALTANSTAFERAMARAQGQLRSFGKAVKSTAMTLGVAFGASQLIGAFKSLNSEMDSIADRSSMLNISAERYQQFGYAAKMTGTEIGTVEAGMKRLDMTLAKAVSGEKGAIDAFRALGLDLAEMRKLQPDQLFDLVAKSLSEITDPAEKSAAQLAIFGKNGAELNNFLRDYLKLGDEAKERGLLFTDEDVKAANELADAFDNFGQAIKVLVGNSGLTKWLRDVAEGIQAVKNLGAEASGFVAELGRQAVRIAIDYNPLAAAQTIAAKIRGEETLGEQAAAAILPANDTINLAAATAEEVASANQARQTRIAERAEREAKRAAYLAEKAAAKPEAEKAAKAEKINEPTTSVIGDFSASTLARALVGGVASPADIARDAADKQTSVVSTAADKQTAIIDKAAQSAEKSFAEVAAAATIPTEAPTSHLAELFKAFVAAASPAERTANAAEALLEQSREQTQIQRGLAQNSGNTQLVYA